MTACEHAFGPCDVPGYLLCRCGTYWSPSAPPAEEVYTADYWTWEKGHSTLEEQVYNVNVHEEGGVTKNDFLLSRIQSARGAALEIGCAPGVLLKRLHTDAGFDRIVGIEADWHFEAPMRQVNGTYGMLLFGMFPGRTDHQYPAVYDLIVAADVFEHSHTPEAFLAECARLLKSGGQLLLMLPLSQYAPGEAVEARMFCPAEHVYIHSRGNLLRMLLDAGFAPWSVAFSRWCPGHECVSAIRGEG